MRSLGASNRVLVRSGRLEQLALAFIGTTLGLAAGLVGAAITLPAQLPDGVTIFHAGTARDADGLLRADGGRVLNVTAVAGSFGYAVFGRVVQQLSHRYECHDVILPLLGGMGAGASSTV